VVLNDCMRDWKNCEGGIKFHYGGRGGRGGIKAFWKQFQAKRRKFEERKKRRMGGKCWVGAGTLYSPQMN